jgi:hypothetical protein
VTDRATGRPATGSVHAYTAVDNPHLDEFPGYRWSFLQQAGLDAEGRFGA